MQLGSATRPAVKIGRGIMETKPAIQTTEFWVAMLSNLGGVLNLLGAWNFSSNKWAVIGMAIINGLYAVGRGNAKSGVAYNPSAYKQ